MYQTLVPVQKDYDAFISYDTKTVNCEMNCAQIKLPREDWYYVAIHDISLKFADDYEPDEFTGYLIIYGMKNSMQTGILEVGGNVKSTKGVLFPMKEPAEQFPKCKIYNRLFMQPDDKYIIGFADKFLNIIPMERIRVNLHLATNLRTLYID